MRRLGLGPAWPSTRRPPFEACEPWLAHIDLLLVMSVHPGFGGQQFMPVAIEKIARAAEMARRDGLDLAIEVDGGIDADTVVQVAEAGADTFVAGSAIFDHRIPSPRPEPSERRPRPRRRPDERRSGSGVR